MFPSLFSLFRRRGKSCAPAPSSARPRSRLGCEMLEDRLTPSAGVFYWMGVNNNGFGDTANWYVNGSPGHSTPESGDWVFVGNGSVSNDFTVPSAFSFYLLNTSSSYTGTIGLQDETSVGALSMNGGNIAMVGSSSSGNDFYVTSSFSFTGGNLNSSTNTGTVHIQGISSATIGNSSTGVTTGSTLSTENGTNLYYSHGAINFANNATIFCHEGTSIQSNYTDALQTDDNFVFINQATVTPPPVVVRGYFELMKGSDFGILVERDPAKTLGGLLDIRESATIKGSAIIGVPAGPSLGMTDGRIRFSDGVTLTVQQGVGISGGVVQTLGSANLVGSITFAGGTLDIGSFSAFGTFAVTGSIWFTGGVYKPDVNGAANNSQCDTGRAPGSFTTAASRESNLKSSTTLAVVSEVGAGESSRPLMAFCPIPASTKAISHPSPTGGHWNSPTPKKHLTQPSSTERLDAEHPQPRSQTH